MTDDLLRAYLAQYYNYTFERAQALIENNRDEENRASLEAIVGMKLLREGNDIKAGEICY